MAKTNWDAVCAEYTALVMEQPDITLKTFCEERCLGYAAARKQFSRRSGAGDRAAPAVPTTVLKKTAREWDRVRGKKGQPDSLLYPGTLAALIDQQFVSPADAAILHRTAEMAHLVYEETEKQRLILLDEIANPPPPPPAAEKPAFYTSPQDRLFSLLLNASEKISKLEGSLVTLWQSLERNRLNLRQQAHRDADEARRAGDYSHKLQARELVTEGLRLKQEGDWDYTKLAEWLTARGVWELPDLIMMQVRAELESEGMGDESVTYAPMTDDEIKARAAADAKRLADETALATEKSRLVAAALDDSIQEDANDWGNGRATAGDAGDWDDDIDHEREEAELEASIRQQANGGGSE